MGGAIGEWSNSAPAQFLCVALPGPPPGPWTPSARLGVAGPGAAPGPSWPREKWELRAPALNPKR